MDQVNLSASSMFDERLMIYRCARSNTEGDHFEDLRLNDMVTSTKVTTRRKLHRLRMDPTLHSLLERGTKHEMESGEPSNQYWGTVEACIGYAGAVGTMVVDEIATIAEDIDVQMGDLEETIRAKVSHHLAQWDMIERVLRERVDHLEGDVNHLTAILAAVHQGVDQEAAQRRTEVRRLRDMMRGMVMAYNTQERVLAILRRQVGDAPQHIMEDFAQILEGNVDRLRGQVEGRLVPIEEAAPGDIPEDPIVLDEEDEEEAGGSDIVAIQQNQLLAAGGSPLPVYDELFLERAEGSGPAEPPNDAVVEAWSRVEKIEQKMVKN